MTERSSAHMTITGAGDVGAIVNAQLVSHNVDGCRSFIRSSLVRCNFSNSSLWSSLICCSLLSSSFVSSSTFLGNVTPTDYIRRWAYPGLNGIMVITGDRQHMSPINNPNHLEHMMSLDTNGTGARTLKRTTNVEPVESHINLRTVVPSEML